MSRTATARLTVPTQVDWICSECGAVNRTTQGVTFTGTAQGTSLWKNQEKLKAKAREDLSAVMEKASGKFAAGDFRAAKLKTACASCGHREPWASYSEITNWIVWPFLAGLLGLFVYYILYEEDLLLCLSLGVMLLPLLVSWIVVSIRNGARRREIQKLPRSSWPVLTRLR